MSGFVSGGLKTRKSDFAQPWLLSISKRARFDPKDGAGGRAHSGVSESVPLEPHPCLRWSVIRSRPFFSHPPVRGKGGLGRVPVPRTTKTASHGKGGDDE
jgi:hypothetical protein